MFESCVEIRSHFSDYLDSRCEPGAFRSIRFHLDYCPACREEMELRETLRADLRGLPRRRVSPELSLALRVRLSQQIHRNWLGRAMVRLENALQPLLLPASAGVLTAVICFGVFLGSGVPPARHYIPDVPSPITTPPRVQALAPLNFSTGEQPLVMVTYIDADGRVTDYKLISGEATPELTRHLDRMFLFSLFHPATAWGKPTEGQVVLSLRRITVRG